MNPVNINPMQWHQSQGLARQACARIFRDGGLPADALRAFGLDPGAYTGADWGRTVDTIATTLCQVPERRAA